MSQRSSKIRARLMVLFGLALGAIFLHVFLGSSDAEAPFTIRYSIREVLSTIFSGAGAESDSLSTIVWSIRLPRAVACCGVGMVLGIVGSAFQALFRNPLAEPYVVGASSGAAVGGALAVSFGISEILGGTGIVICATATGFASLLLVIAMARVKGIIDPQRLLISGVVISSMLSALVACVLLAAGQDSNRVLSWLLGSMTPMYWSSLPILYIVLIIGGFMLYRQTRNLNVFAVGEETAIRLGVNAHRLKPIVLAVGTIMTAVAVGIVGIIGFLGMVAPHIARRIVGVDWRVSLPASGLIGAALLTLSDILAQWAVPGAELPVGIVTALLGAPTLLFLLRREAA